MTIILLVINEYLDYSHNYSMEEKMNKETKEFARRIDQKFNGEATKGAKDYFLGYGLKFGKKTVLNAIIDDRDVERMSKGALINSLKNILNELNPSPSTITPKAMLLSDLDEKNIWKSLGDYCEIMDIKSLTTFFNVTLPEGFQEAFDKLPDEFRLDDFRRELEKITNREHHRNTYQNWMSFLRKAEYVTLKNKTYTKTPRFNRSAVLKSKIKEIV